MAEPRAAYRLDVDHGHRLLAVVYVARLNGAIHPLELPALLDRARAHYREVGISGVLLRNHDNLMHYLEGPAPAVQDSLAHIARDRRHHGLTRLLESELPTREFADQPLIFVDVANGPGPLWLDLNAEPPLAGSETGTLAQLLLRSFARSALG